MAGNLVAPELQKGTGESSASRRTQTAHHGPMSKDLQVRLVAIVLLTLTVTSVIFAWINYTKESQWESPYDGVWWVEHNGSVHAERVDPGGPGEKAGIKTGDVL